MTASEPLDVIALGSLADPVRRRLYAYVRDSDLPVSRDQAATAAGIGRTLAAYHLDKLAAQGLVTVAYERPPGRRGPGAGRPAKLYGRADTELAVSVPPRDYELLAELLIEAVERDPEGTVRDALNRTARKAGRRLAAGGDLRDALCACGYEPYVGAVMELRNCPFHALAQTHRELVCALNLQLVRGLIAGSTQPHARAVLEPRAGQCCLTVHDA